MKEVPRRRNEGTKRTSMERMWCGGVSFQCSFLLLLMVWSYNKRQYTDKHVTLSKCMCMRASGASELRKFWNFHILKLFLYIFCWYIENKSWFNFIWGGGQAPPPPQAPHQYASAHVLTNNAQLLATYILNTPIQTYNYKTQSTKLWDLFNSDNWRKILYLMQIGDFGVCILK